MYNYRPSFKKLEAILENRMFIIPVYQRPYSWNREHVIDLLNDINEYYNSNEEFF